MESLVNWHRGGHIILVDFKIVRDRGRGMDWNESGGKAASINQLSNRYFLSVMA